MGGSCLEARAVLTVVSTKSVAGAFATIVCTIKLYGMTKIRLELEKAIIRFRFSGHEVNKTFLGSTVGKHDGVTGTPTGDGQGAGDVPVNAIAREKVGTTGSCVKMTDEDPHRYKIRP
jgi:hypothetical protein